MRNSPKCEDECCKDKSICLCAHCVTNCLFLDSKYPTCKRHHGVGACIDYNDWVSIIKKGDYKKWIKK